MPIQLQQLNRSDLAQLALGQTPACAIDHALPGALPPAFVAVRSLHQLGQGCPALWCLGFLVLADDGRTIVGSCGFKHAPVDGLVEIGYGIAPGARRQGYASSAVADLLTIARASGQVNRVLAQVNPDNQASTRVVRRLGFSAGVQRLDHEGELLVQWLIRLAV